MKRKKQVKEIKKCIGSGFCCMMEQCRASIEIHGEVNECPELIFKDNRFWCALMDKDPKLVKEMMGIGCGAHWNRWRKDVKKRSKKDYEDYYDKDLIYDLANSYKKGL